MTEKSSRNILEAFIEGAEAAIDLAVESEAIKAVPVVGTAFKLLKGLDDIRSRILMGKLYKFINEPSLRDAIEARKLRHEILNDSEREQEIGEMLFLVLEKVTDMTKPVLLARAYASYLGKQITSFEFESVAYAIDVAFVRDLLKFLNPSSLLENILWEERLVAVGLLMLERSVWHPQRKYPEILHYQETEMGMTFRRVVARV